MQMGAVGSEDKRQQNDNMLYGKGRKDQVADGNQTELWVKLIHTAVDIENSGEYALKNWIMKDNCNRVGICHDQCILQ